MGLLEAMQEYKHKEIELEDYNFSNDSLGFSVDTRDFKIIEYSESKKVTDLDVLKKYPTFFFTIDEVKEILFNIYNKSGKKVRWRMIAFENDSKDNFGWNWKYISIIKTDLGFLIGACGSTLHFYRKDFFRDAKLHADEYIAAH